MKYILTQLYNYINKICFKNTISYFVNCMWLEKNEITNLVLNPFEILRWKEIHNIHMHTHIMEYGLYCWNTICLYDAKFILQLSGKQKGLDEVRRSKRRLCVWGQNAQITYRVTFYNKQNKILSLMLIKSIIALHYHLITNMVICTKPLINSVFDSLISLI